MAELHSYCKPLSLGHRGLEEMWDENLEYVCQEKIDGSQFSFGVDLDGKELYCRSRTMMIDLDNPGMFSKGVETVKSLKDNLVPGLTYRGEFLGRPKHNALTYERVPVGFVILYDIDVGQEDYLGPVELGIECDRIGLECVPTWIHKGIPEYSQVKAWAGEVSCLGKVLREGVVIKSYGHFDPHTYKTFMAKYVREEFKEENATNWKKMNPGRKDVVQFLVETYRTEARWRKAVQHLQEAGTLLKEPADIGGLLVEVKRDLKEECEAEIKQALFDALWKDVGKGATAGLAEWWKEQLAQGAI